MKKNELDEMQVQFRNKIGNQTLLIMFYLLLIDIGLYGFGVRWLKYPMNVFVIILACMVYYLVRIISKNAYIGPCIKSKSLSLKVIGLIAVTVVISIAASLLLKNRIPNSNVTDKNDNSALILFIVSIVSLIIVGITALIKKKQNKDK